MNEEIKAELRDGGLPLLRKLTGKFVRVAITEDGHTRNTFEPQMAIGGILEQHPEKTYQYRVMVNDETFTYFNEDNVILVTEATSKPTVMIKIVTDA